MMNKLNNSVQRRPTNSHQHKNKDSLLNKSSQPNKKPFSSEPKKSIEESEELATNSSTPGQSTNSKENEDIYEFKSTSKESSGNGNEDKTVEIKKNENRPGTTDDKNVDDIAISSGSGSVTSNIASSINTSNISGGTKRSFSDIEGNDDGCSEADENKRRKRSNLEVKDTNKHVISARGMPQRLEKNVKQIPNPNKTTLGGTTGKTTTNLERKSPCSSPNKGNDSDAEADDAKSAESFGGGGGPKVPPLKIVIPQQNTGGDNDLGSRNGKNNSTRNHPALPYVVASSSNSNDSVAADRESTSSRCASPADSTGKLTSSNLTCTPDDKGSKATSEERAQQRVLRSSHRSGGQSVDRGSNNSSPQLQSSSPSPAPATNQEIVDIVNNRNVNNNSSPAAQVIIQSENETSGNAPSPSASSTSSSKEILNNIAELHPRKRKIRAKQEETANKASTSNAVTNHANTNESNTTITEVHPHDHPFTNCYQMYINIRKQIEKKHKSLLPIQPRPPQGFKDYLLNRKTYILAKNTSAEPSIVFPKNLNSQMEELFRSQEIDRYKLKIRHLVEREKLGLTVEQEILRVHAKAARSLACQSMPFSACTLIRDDEVYNMITPEQEEKDRNARSRYNGRLFLSWLQDVDDKWEKIKDSMLLRHHNEAESLHAVQKMDWEWIMKENSLCDYKSQPVIDETHVPMIPVNDDFDLLPA